MQAALFLQSLWIGLSIAAPVGPIGLLVIQRTLRHGAALGLATGLGAACADAIYGAIGAYGVSTLIGVLQGARVPLAIAGGAFLLWLAWRTWHAAAPLESAHTAPAPRLLPAYFGTLLLTLSNPATILSFMAIFGSILGARPDTQAGAGAHASPGLMALGVLLGSALWWLLLSSTVVALRGRFDEPARRLVGRVAALMLAAFALWQWAALLWF